ncbi:MAG TPA: tetratricopeptide repeat protein [Acholeplasma sp.]|nr:tetratricopeptide repeat protein [Acholeplasma sp.]
MPSIIRNPSKRFIENLEINNLNKAEEIYNDKLISDTVLKQNADTELLNNIQLIYDNYIDKTVGYNDTIIQLNEYKIFTSIKSDLDMIISSVEKMNKSRESYDKGIEYYNNKNYDEAMQQFSKVIEEDGNYLDAQIKINELSILIAKDYIVKAKEYFDKEQFNDAINYINKAMKLQPNNSEYVSLFELYNDTKEKAEEKKRQEEEKKMILTEGKNIDTSNAKITFKKCEFTTKILPNNTSGSYTYYSSSEDEIYLDFIFDLKNSGKYDLDLDTIISNVKVNYDNGYTYDGYSCFYTTGDRISSVLFDYLEPLKSTTFHLAIRLPREIADTDKSLEVTFDVLNQKQKIKIR